MDLSKIGNADLSPVIAAALGALFQTHPDRGALLRAWTPLAAAMPMLAIQAGKTDVANDPNVVLAQMLLAVLQRPETGPLEMPPTRE